MVVRDDAEMKGRITPEGVDAFRNRIGILIPEPPPFNSEAHLDSIRHFAGCYGDENPLYCDRQYAKRTRWGGLIAPPLYIMTLGETTVPPIPPEVRKAGAGALRGVPNYLSGGRWEWVRPIQEGDQVRVNYFIEDVEEKRSQFGGGKAVVVHHRKEFINQRDEVVGIRRYYFFHTEREASEKAAKYMDFEPTYYTEEMNQEIDDAYENEYVRGPDTLYWEDVEPDMSMPVLVKGPLSTMDIVTWHMGIGWGVFRVGSYRIGYKNRKRVPAFYTKTEDGFWAPAQRLHWDNDRARKVGNPRAYDYGNVRTSWIIHYLTNWMGDDGFLWKQSDEARKFNYHGDTTWVRGKVLSKRQEGERNIVELEVWCENQRGEVSSPGSGTVLLPSRERGPVKVPAGGTEPSGMKTEYAVDIPGCVW
jgi:acyl dehydratase